MKKISTLFKKNPEKLALVTNEINPENQWVFDGEGIATRKYDGTAAAIIKGQLYKRYDVKKGKQVPPNAIPCQEPDEITGHWPHWVLCDINKAEDKYFFEGYNSLAEPNKIENDTYELVGEKVQNNREKISGHQLIKHGSTILSIPALNYDSLKQYFANPENDIEGIVFHHPDGRMCKIRKSDFGIKR